MIRIGLLENRTAYEPGDTLAGAVLWELPSAPKTAELRLLWFTRGKGSEDCTIVETVTFDAPLAGDTRNFSITLPPAPYSFDGRLISLIWAVEMVLDKECERTELVIAPGGREVTLPRIEQPAKPKPGF